MLFGLSRDRTKISGSHLARTDTFWISDLTRDRLAELVSAQPAKTQRVSMSQLGTIDVAPDSAVGIWRAPTKQGQSPLPQVIIGKQAVLEDLVAWVATYLPTLGPLSGQCRLLTPKAFQDAHRKATTSDWRSLAGSAVALCFGEVLSYASHSVQPTDISFIMCRSTLSFALMRSAALGRSANRLQETAEAWKAVRNRLGQSTNLQSSELILQIVLDFAFDTPVGKDDAAAGFHGVLDYNVDVQSFLEDYGSKYTYKPLANRIRDSRTLTAEEKVELFDLVSPELTRDNRRNALESGQILASLAFWCRAGFAQQLAIMSPYQKALPQSTIWLAALHQSEPLMDTLSLGGGVGWRVAKELFRTEDIFQSPACDISMLELEVLTRGNNLERIVGSWEQSRMEVELFPGVSTIVRSNYDSTPKQSEPPMDERAPQLPLGDYEMDTELKSVEGLLRKALKDIQTMRKQSRG